MHELSIVQAMVEEACEAATREGGSRVTRLTARIGALAGVAAESLLFSFDLAAEGTLCEGAVLEIEEIPVSIFCRDCNAAQTLQKDYFALCCPLCGAAARIISGRELELASLLIEYEEDLPHAATNS